MEDSANTDRSSFEHAAAVDTDRVNQPLIRVVIATPFGPGGRGGIDRLVDLMVMLVGQSPPGALTLRRVTTRGMAGRVSGSFVCMRALTEYVVLCIFQRVDVLHINVAADGSFYRKAIFAGISRLFGVPYVIHIHSGRFGPFWDSAPGLGRHVIHSTLIGSAAVVVLGTIYRQLIDRRLPGLASKVFVLPNATPSRTPIYNIDKPSACVQITCLGRLGPNKGTPQLIAALARLKTNPNWRATLAGDGAVADAQSSADAAGLADRVHLPGWLETADVERILGATDILVLPSFSEGLPMAIIEAFSAGIAVIATPVNAIAEVVEHDRNGLLVPPGDVEALTQALTRLINDPALRRSLGNAAYLDHKAHYEPRAYMERLVTIWRRAACKDWSIAPLKTTTAQPAGGCKAPTVLAPEQITSGQRHEV